MFLESFRRGDVIPESDKSKVWKIISDSEGVARTDQFRRRSGEMEVQQLAEQHARSDSIGKKFLLELNDFQNRDYLVTKSL